jgi:hypothetical protein
MSIHRRAALFKFPRTSIVGITRSRFVAFINTPSGSSGGHITPTLRLAVCRQDMRTTTNEEGKQHSTGSDGKDSSPRTTQTHGHPPPAARISPNQELANEDANALFSQMKRSSVIFGLLSEHCDCAFLEV